MRIWLRQLLALMVVATLAGCRTKSEPQEQASKAPGASLGASRARLPVEDLAPACNGVLPETVNTAWRLGGLSVAGGATLTETFAASNDADALLVIQNGDGRGAGEAQSATVSLNGVAAGGLSTGQRLSVSRVTLSATNQLSVEAQGTGRVRVSVAELGTLPCVMADTGYLQPGHSPAPAAFDFEPKGEGTLGVLLVDMMGATPDAQVLLNGVDVLLGVASAQRRAYATAIPLNATNHLEVLVQGGADSNVRVAIFDADTLPTSLSITEPEAGSYFTSSPIVVAGKYGRDGKSLTINGVPAWLVGSDGFNSQVPLVDGVNSVTAVMADSCGNVSRMCRAVVLDLNAPVITVSGVSEGDVTQGPVTVGWGAVSPYVVTTVATLNGTPIQNNTTVSAEGEYDLLVTAEDPEGRVAMKRVRFTLLLRAPLIEVTGVSEGEFAPGWVTPSIQVTSPYLEVLNITVNGVGHENNTPVTQEGTHTLYIVAKDRAGNYGLASVTFTIDWTYPVVTLSGVVDGAFVNAPVVVSYTATDSHMAPDGVEALLDGQPYLGGDTISAEGIHTVKVVARDKANNRTTSSVSFTLDSTPPLLTVSGVPEESPVAQVVTPTFSATDTNPGGLSATLNGVPFVSGTEVADDGSYLLEVQAEDRAGNTTSTVKHFVIDRTPPLVSVTGVQEGELRRTPTTISWTVEDAHPGTVSATLGGAPFTSGSTVSAEGAHLLVITATDSVGNVREERRHFTIDVTAADVTIRKPMAGLVTREAQVEVEVEVVDANPVDHVEVGGELLSKGADGRWRRGVSVLEGSNLLVVTVVDAAGNTSTRSVSVVRDSTSPVLTVVEPEDGARIPGLTVTVRGVVTDATTVALTLNGTPAVLGADGAFSIERTLVPGATSLELRAKDAAGNETVRTLNVRANATQPTLTLSEPQDGLVTEASSVMVRGTALSADSSDSVTVTVDGVLVDVDASGHFSRAITLAVGETHAIAVVARDGYGLTREVSRTIRRTQDVDGGMPDGGAEQDGGTPSQDAGTPTPDAGAPSQDAGTPPRDAGSSDGSDAGTGSTPDAGANEGPAPVLVVEAPLEGGVYGGAHFVVSGRIEGGTLPLRVTVHGVNMAVNGREFTGALSLAEGEYSLQFRVTDARGRTHAQTRAVVVDHSPPQLTLTPPTPPQSWDRISQSPYLLTGTVGDLHLSEVQVDGVPARVVAGTFSAYVTLPPQEPTQVVVMARDVAGNRTQRTVTLTLRGSAPQVTILEPLDGFEATKPEVTVRVRVISAAPLRSLRIGTESIEVSPAREEYTAKAHLSLGGNVIRVIAEDAQVSEGDPGGMVGADSVTVRYRDANQEPLAVTGVSPRAGEQGVEPDSLVSVSFNKPIRSTALADRFTVKVTGEGAALPGGYSVAPGGQTVSFIARDPLPEGARLTVLVKDLEAVTAPGMGGGEFSSEFTVRRPLTRVRGYVVDSDYRPLPGVKVSVDGSALSTVSGPDGNWTLFTPRGGEMVLRYEGGLTSEGQAFPTVRRRLFVNAEGDTLDAPLALTAVDTASAQGVDALRRMELDFAGRHPGLRVDVQADGLFFEDGTTHGLVTATEIQPYALPLPMEGRAGLGALWQVGPAGLRLQKSVSVTFPNRSNLPAGRLVMVLGHDPQRHQLKRVGFARVSSDETVLSPVSPLGLTSLEFLGYVPLDETQHAAVATALGLGTSDGGAGAPTDGGSGLQGLRQRVRPSPSSEPLWRKFLSNFAVTEAHAQLGGGLTQAAYNAFDTLARQAVPGAVTGSVRAPLERQLELDVSKPIIPKQGMPAVERIVTLPYTLALDFRSRFVSADPYDVANPETVLVKLMAEGPHGPLPEPAPGAWQSQGVGEAAVVQDLALPEGRTELTLSALSKSTHRFLKLEAELVPEPGDGGPTRAKLRIRTVQDTFSELGDEAVHSPIRFKNLRVTVTGPGGGSVGMTGASGGYGIPVTGLTGGEMGIACTEVPTGPRLVERVGEDGVVHYTPTLNQFPICSQTFQVSPGSTTRADIQVDVRMLHGALTFVNRRGEPLALNCEEDVHSEKAQTPGEFADIALRDVKSTEVHFFREDDLEHPIATFAAGTPNGTVCSQGTYQLGDPHGYYTRVRTGPAARIRQVARERCRELERERGASDGGGLSDADQGYYDGNCRDNRTNHLRLSPGDRLVVFAVNHATGYSGMTRVTVPAVNRAERTSTGACQADDDAGGPLQVTELGETMTLSRCTQAELGIPADLQLFPPELDIRVSRRMTPEGVQVAARPSLVRHGGAGTTKDDFLQLDTHWRVRQLPEVALDGGVGGDAGTPSQGDGGADEASCLAVGFLPDGGICEPGRLKDLGVPGEELEQFCSELPASSPQRLLGRCDTGTPRVVDVPPGVPSLAGRVVRVTGTAEEQPVVVTFPVRPGRHTASVQTPLTYVDGQGALATLGALPMANYYLHVVGHPMLERDRNDDGFLQFDEVNAPPPNFCEPGECTNRDGEPEAPGDTGANPESLPKWALGLKNVYRHREVNGSALERYDRAREHEFRVLELGAATVIAEGGEHVRPDGGVGGVDAGRVLTGTRPEATDDDVAYQFLLNGLQEPEAGRADTLSGQYRLRLGTDDFGIECPVEFNPEQKTLSGTCDGEYLPEVLSAADILYFELYLSGNADNVLYRFNFHGISPRTDFVTAGSEDTQARSLARSTPATPSPVGATERPISVKAMAQFAIEPDVLTEGTIRLCEGTECNKDTLLKAAELRYVRDETTGNGQYQVVRYLDEADADIAQPLIIQPKPGANGAGRFALPLANHLGRMENMGAQGREVFLTIEPKAGPSGPVRPVKQVLGEPVGRYAFVNARAAGQTVVQGVNLAGGHLSVTHEDFSVPQLTETVSFSRTFNNQNNEVSALGVGWSHSYEGFVMEEELGRYVVVLNGQSYDFPSCTTVDPAFSSASNCKTDKSHGGSLTVDLEGAEFRTETGMVYRFKTESALATGIPDQRRWVLTEFSDGQGKDSPKQGWTTLSYVPGSDLVARVSRAPGHVTLAFEYKDVDGREYAEKLRLLARSRSLKLLSAVGLYPNSSIPAGAGQSVNPASAVHRVEFEHDSWGNLLKAVRRTGQPRQAWAYEYAPVPTTATGYTRWRLVNELRASHYRVTQDTVPPGTGDLEYFDQWVANYESKGTSKTYEHVHPGEIIDSAVSTGSGPRPYQYAYPGTGQRRVKRPDGVDVVFALTEYGSSKSVKVGTLPEQKTQWREDGQISPSLVTLSNQSELKYDIDASHRLLSLELQKAPPIAEGFRGTTGVGTGSTLVRQTFTHAVNKQFGIPDQRITPAQTGTQSVITRVTAAGEIEGVSVLNSDGTTALNSGVRSFRSDGSGVLTSETDALNQQITYGEPNDLGLPQVITLTHPQAGALGLATLTRQVTYDGFGRVVGLKENETGAEEAWQYDSLGRVTRHFIKAQPSQEWTYTYTQANRRVTVQERLNGSEPLRTVDTWEVVGGDEASRGVYVEDRTPYGPPGQEKVAVRKRHIQNGRVVATTDGVGVERSYEYDASGRLTGVHIVGAGTTAGPSDAYESRYQDFDSNGNARAVLDQNGLLTRVGYDFLGRAMYWDYTGAETVSGERSSEEWGRNFGGDVLYRAFGNSASSHILDMVPDALGRVRATKTNLSGSAITSVDSSAEYDGLGRVVRQRDLVMGADEWFEYQDALGRLTRYSRTIESGEGPLELVEERRYEDATHATTGLRKVSVTRTIEMAEGPPRTEQTEEFRDVTGRLMEEVRTVSGLRASWKYTYNARGQVQSIIAPTEGTGTETTTFQYDSAGNLYRMSAPGDANNPAAVTETFVDAEGRVVRQKGPHPDADWQYTYDAFGQLKTKELVATTANPVGALWTFGYGLTNKPGADGTVPNIAVEETDPLGYKTYRFFNARYQLLKEVREDKRAVAGGGTSTNGNTVTTTYAYVGDWLQKQITTEKTDGAAGSPSVLTVEHKKFDDRGRSLESREHWQRGTDSYEYVTKSPWAGRTVSVTQTGTVSTSPTVLLPSRQFDSATNSLGQTVSRSQGGLTDSWEYDAVGLMMKTQPAGQPATSYSYDQGLLVDIAYGTGGLTEHTRMAYRLDGRLKSVTDPANRVRSLSYGPRGLVTREVFGREGEFAETKYAYDAGGFVSRVWKDPDSTADYWQYQYGPLGELVSVTPPGLSAFSYGYDGLRRLTSINRPPGGVPSESFEYDYQGRSTRRVRGTSDWTTSWVNGVERATSPSNAEGAGGGDRDLVETLKDGRGRPVWKTFNPGPSSAPQQDITRLTFAYDAFDELVQANEVRSSGSVLNSFRYDSRGRLDQVRRGKDSALDKEDMVEYTYVLGADLLKRRVSGLAADGPRLEQEFGYDLLGRINSVLTRDGGPLVPSRTVEWEPGGGQLTRVADAALVERWCYDGRGWLESVRTTTAIADADCNQSPADPKIGFRYTYDSRGNRLREDVQYQDSQEAAVNEFTDYGYDKADRLTGVRYPGGVAELYSLAADGTRLGLRHVLNHSGSLGVDGYDLVSHAEKRLVYSFDGAGGLKSIDDMALPTEARRHATYFTDGSGRVRRVELSAVSRTDYNWDAGDRLVQVRTQELGTQETGTNTTIRHGYGFDGLRRSKDAANGDARYVWVGDGLVEEESVGGPRLHQESLAGRTISIAGERVFHDGLGSVTGRIKADGTDVYVRFDAWGGYRDGTTPEQSQPSVGYTGHSWDRETRLTYAQQRWYDSSVGRFVSEDPVKAAQSLSNPMGMQPWSYADGNPIRWTDPDGRRAGTVEEMLEIRRWEESLRVVEKRYSGRSPIFQLLQKLPPRRGEALAIEVLRDNIAGRNQAIERAADGESVLSGSYLFGQTEIAVSNGVSLSLPTHPQYLTAKESYASRKGADGAALSFSPLSTVYYGAAAVLGGTEEQISGAIQAGGHAWEIAVGTHSALGHRLGVDGVRADLRGSRPEVMRGSALGSPGLVVKGMRPPAPQLNDRPRLEIISTGIGVLRGPRGVQPDWPGKTSKFDILFPGNNKHMMLTELLAGGVVSMAVEAGDKSPMRGSVMWARMLDHYGENIRAVSGKWTFGTNLAQFNERTGCGWPPEVAARHTWTGWKASELGYHNVKFVVLEGTPGKYVNVEVLYSPMPESAYAPPIAFSWSGCE
ncbi:hypothetical protein HUA74_16725 [Myxococcus sp. CA051A]|uniref:RHS repeat-associated core domain-containing protein n=1 Tax=Myxococcus sp. CA051A TaxID=2741739 RepID=UPI001C2D6CFB|nr:RHS repeat-associated core domain-containing protein [Myxococcus sp. CA051A]NTX62301.1 hypothetical protein [Myxococcus sp. CA051A]